MECDRGHAHAAEAGKIVAHPRLALAASILASSTAFVDGADVNVALPAIKEELQVGAASLQWVVNAYLLPLSGLLLLGGATGDRFGRRRLFLIGCWLFTAATLLCFFAPSLEWMLAGRALQGIGSALLMPNSLALIGAHFSGEARGRAIGIWAAAGAIAGAIGPMIGGWLVDTLGWRTIFLLDLPLVLGALLLAWRFVEESKADSRHGIDWLGVAVATGGLGAITWGLTRLSGDSASSADWVVLAAGAALLILFIAIERRRGERAIMPLAMFGTASFAGLTLLTFLLYAALGGLFVMLPYALIVLNGYTPLQAGAALLPLPAIIGIASPAMGALAARTGPRWPLSFGPLIVAAGFALTTRLDAEAAYFADVLPGLIVIGIGMAGAVAPLTTAVMASVDTRHVGTANGFNSAIARTGGLIATALLGSALAARGADLAAAYDAAAWVAAGAAAAAGLAALILLRPREIATPGKTKRIAKET